MRNKINIFHKEIDYSCSYQAIRKSLEAYADEDEYYLKNAEMECRRIVEGKYIEFNISMISLFIALVVLCRPIFEKCMENHPNICFPIIIIVGIILIMVMAIHMHRSCQGARKILFVLSDMKTES